PRRLTLSPHTTRFRSDDERGRYREQGALDRTDARAAVDDEHDQGARARPSAEVDRARIERVDRAAFARGVDQFVRIAGERHVLRSEEHTSELQSREKL